MAGRSYEFTEAGASRFPALADVSGSQFRFQALNCLTRQCRLGRAVMQSWRARWTRIYAIVGTRRRDRITGNNHRDRILSLRGRDSVAGGRGNDCADGGAGRDVIAGSLGATAYTAVGAATVSTAGRALTASMAARAQTTSSPVTATATTWPSVGPARTRSRPPRRGRSPASAAAPVATSRGSTATSASTPPAASGCTSLADATRHARPSHDRRPWLGPPASARYRARDRGCGRGFVPASTWEASPGRSTPTPQGCLAAWSERRSRYGKERLQPCADPPPGDRRVTRRGQVS